MSRGIFCLCTVHFFGNFSYLLMASFYAKEAISKGVSEALVGLVFSATPAMAFITSLLMPPVYRVIRKKTAVAIGLAVTALSLVLLGLSGLLTGYEFFALGLVARVLAGIAIGTVTTTDYCLAITVYPTRAKEIISYLEMCAGVSSAVGSAVGAPVYAAAGPDAVFYGSSVLFLLSLGLVPLLTEVVSVEETEKMGLGPLLKCRRMMLDSGTVVVVILCFGLIIAYIEIHLLALGATMDTIGLVLGLIATGYAAISMILSRIIERLNTQIVMYTGVAVAVLSMLLIAPVPEVLPSNPWVVTAGFFLLSGAMSLTFVPSIPHMIEVAVNQGWTVNDALTDAVSSVGSSAFFLGEAAGPLLGGAMLMGLSFVNMSLVIAGLLAAWLVIYLAGSLECRARQKRHSEEELLDVNASI